jgi:hypothetical protein
LWMIRISRNKIQRNPIYENGRPTLFHLL